jgi:hypothetical protein
VSLLKGDFEKAETYIAAYKPIDKNVKSMFGLVSTRNSDELETLLNIVRARPENETKSASDKALTMSEIQAISTYLSIPGTIVLEGKNAGTYEGLIQIRRPEPKLNSEDSKATGMMVLGAEDLLIQVPTTDKAGKPLVVRSAVVKSLKGSDGTDYQIRKFGTVGFADGAIWYLLRSDYQSPKVTVFRSVLPSANEFVVLKPGDSKGVKSSFFNARRNVLDYLKDCAVLEGKYKDSNAPFDIKQVALDYTNCP